MKYIAAAAMGLVLASCAGGSRAPIVPPSSTAVMQDLTEDQVAQSIGRALNSRGWRINEHKHNRFLATQSESDWFVTIRIIYSADTYNIEYHDSQNFRYNDKKQTIDEHYPVWIANLQASIDKELRRAHKFS